MGANQWTDCQKRSDVVLERRDTTQCKILGRHSGTEYKAVLIGSYRRFEQACSFNLKGIFIDCLDHEYEGT
jgi:hypothetical protein